MNIEISDKIFELRQLANINLYLVRSLLEGGSVSRRQYENLEWMAGRINDLSNRANEYACQSEE